MIHWLLTSIYFFFIFLADTALDASGALIFVLKEKVSSLGKGIFYRGEGRYPPSKQLLPFPKPFCENSLLNKTQSNSNFTFYFHFQRLRPYSLLRPLFLFKMKKKFFVKRHFLQGRFILREEVLSFKIVITPFLTYEKLHCKEQSKRAANSKLKSTHGQVNKLPITFK